MSCIKTVLVNGRIKHITGNVEIVGIRGTVFVDGQGDIGEIPDCLINVPYDMVFEDVADMHGTMAAMNPHLIPDLSFCCCPLIGVEGSETDCIVSGNPTTPVYCAWSVRYDNYEFSAGSQEYPANALLRITLACWFSDIEG